MGSNIRSQPAQIVLAQRSVPYLLQRSSRRRTIVLSVDTERGLVVYCPQRLTRRSLERILREKAHWILEKTAQARRALRQREPITWAPGNLLPWRGRWYPLSVEANGRKRSLGLQGNVLWLSLPAALLGRLERSGLRGTALRGEVHAGYREAAREVLEARVAHFAKRLRVKPSVVRIKAQRRRWGSASAKAALNFNWRLILAPPEVLDYVVVHELCHLHELNHSPRFWSRVAALVPDYRDHQAWLRDHGPALYDL